LKVKENIQWTLRE